MQAHAHVYMVLVLTVQLGEAQVAEAQLSFGFRPLQYKNVS